MDTKNGSYREYRARELSDHRYGEALWYAFGREDATDTSIDAFSFAQYARDEALDYHLGDTHVLNSVSAQWDKWSRDNA